MIYISSSRKHVAKTGNWEESDKEYVHLAKQITWLDFSDNAGWKNLDASGIFCLETVIYKKEISPGYEVILTVTELKFLLNLLKSIRNGGREWPLPGPANQMPPRTIS